LSSYPTPATKDDSITWLYTKLAEDWTQTGLPSSLIPNITNSAFYTLVVRPGLRLISLNTNYCPQLNFWLLINSTDPLGELAWLANTLQQSENIKEKVHIIGHIPPSECYDSWSKVYYMIVNRYESTIIGQFFGHSHDDRIQIYYDLQDKKRPISVHYVGGSATTYSNLNPNYRIYTVDGQHDNTTWQVIDSETTFLNITEANLSGPVWRKEYSALVSFIYLFFLEKVLLIVYFSLKECL
jgi:sphingomyelin phosphodiesterase